MVEKSDRIGSGCIGLGVGLEWVRLDQTSSSRLPGGQMKLGCVWSGRVGRIGKCRVALHRVRFLSGLRCLSVYFLLPSNHAELKTKQCSTRS